jgi:bacillithiol system protein YtxJ
MFWNKSESDNTATSHIDWQFLNSTAELEMIIEQSTKKPQVIFKHSTRCPISSMAKKRLERHWAFDEDTLDIHYLDLIAYRSISNQVADAFGVTHESPQILIIKNKQAVFHTSHNDISVEVIQENI